MTPTDLETAAIEPSPPSSPPAGTPPPAQLQATARAAWLEDPALTGAQLGARFGRGERWGRDRIAEARANGTTTDAAALPHGTNGNDPDAAGHSDGTSGTAATAVDDVKGSGRHDHDAAEGVPASLVVVTKLAVATVALVTMFTSYSHTMDLARVAGQTELVARILPAAVDGLVIAGSTSLLVDHHQHRPGSPLAWAAVVLGLASSMAANVVAVDPTLVDLRHVKWVMAAYAPLALAVSGHLLLRMLGQRT